MEVSVTDKGIWRIRTNQEMREIYEPLNLVSNIKEADSSGRGMRLECIKKERLWIFFNYVRRLKKCGGGDRLI
jgi:predicted phosphatase